MKKKKRKKKPLPKKKKTVKKGQKKKKRKLLYGRIFLAFFILGLLVYLLFSVIGYKIKNIYVSGNEILTDQEIISLAGLEEYPSTFSNLCIPLKQKLEKNDLIKKATVTKSGLYKIYIKIEENRPLFYQATVSKTILLDHTKVERKFDVPTLINYVPDQIYDRFISKMKQVDKEILKRVSEIEYKPNEVDKNRFLLSMQDGNYVYLTLSRFSNINQYVDIIRKFEHKKGILYLDSGEYFKIYEGK